VIPKPLHAVNELLAFLLELVAFGVMCWWGFETGSNLLLNVLLGIGTPALAMLLWGALVNTALATLDRNALMHERRA
jgi:hypothetical protein